jgi:peptide/nickel transport system ATP-binding protein
MERLLSVSDLRVQFETDRGSLQALAGVDFAVDRGETLCLVGESGSGKTVACEALTRLLGGTATVSGTAEFDGRDLLTLSDKQLQDVRGDRIAHVFQNPEGALDPVYTVGDQICEAIHIHRDVSTGDARQRAIELLDRVGIPDPATRIDDYPHEFSGGMKQRVVLAMALSTDPDLLIADEPTTAVDVTTQAQLLALLDDLQRERDLAVLFVTHDLGVVSRIADRVVVLYAGKVMERGGVDDVFDAPAHPYTRALLDSYPRQGRAPEPIGGSLPDPTDPIAGCRFHPRCDHAVEACRTGDHPPDLPVVEDDQPTADRAAACVYYGEGYDVAALDDEATVATATDVSEQGPSDDDATGHATGGGSDV